MTEQRERLEKALRGCAEVGVAEVDLWSGIEENLASTPRRSRKFRFVPRTRMAWAMAALLVLLFSTGAYAASGLLYDMFRHELPGAQEPIFGDKIGLDQSQVANGARVSVEWAYADTAYVVVGFNVENLDDGRRVAGHPAELRPVLVIDEPGYGQRIAEEFPKRITMSDEAGTDFRVVDGGGMVSVAPDNVMDEPIPNTVVFAAQEKLAPGDRHTFRLQIPLEAYSVLPPEENRPPSEPVGEPFDFKFTVPVRPAPVVEIGQKVVANDVAFTLDRVVNSPGRPQAIVCFDPPDTKHDWGLGNVRMGGLLWFTYPFDGGLEYGPAAAYPGSYFTDTPQDKKRCHVVELRPDRSGDYSFEVGTIGGWPRDGSSNGPGDVKTIHGPWKFDFEVPDP